MTPRACLLSSLAMSLGLAGVAAAQMRLPEKGAYTLQNMGETTITGRAAAPAPPPGAHPGYYPEPARAQKAEGHATVRCRLAAAEGTLSACQVVEETPTGLGFGEAAVRDAEQFHLTPERAQELSLDGEVVLPFQFKLDAGAAHPTPYRIAPIWKAAPSTRIMAVALERFAPTLHRPGWGVAECRVNRSGELKDCRGLTGSPEGSGVEDAAASFSDGWIMATTDRDGKPVAGGRVMMIVRFNPL